MVLLFFSFSTGKRGVYILPAVPAFVLACAPFLPDLARQRGPRTTVFGLACAVVVAAFAGAVSALLESGERQKLIDAYGVDIVGPLLAISAAGAVACILARPKHGFAAYGAVVAMTLLIVGFWVNPALDETRSGARFTRNVERLAADVNELGFVAYKEQYLLHVTRPVVNFGHARWREHQQEAADAAAWLAAGSDRALLVDERARTLCFPAATRRDAGVANRTQWFLVRGQADPECVARGSLDAARTYAPPVPGKRSRLR